MPPNPTPPTTRIGVLLVDTVQLLDLSAVDLFHILSEPYLSALPFLPASLQAGAVNIEILYIDATGPTKGGGSGSSLHECTANVAVRVDAKISDEGVCAPPTTTKKNEKMMKSGGEKKKKTLDILLIPGPDPFAYKPSEAINGFIKGHFEAGTDVLSVCTGIYPVGYAGVLEGRKATGPRELVPELKRKFPEASAWVDKRWVEDGNLWCSAGITNGHDMVAAYMRHKWPGPTVEAVLAMAEVGDRTQEYGISKAGNNAWWLWTIVRAWMFPYKK